MKTLNPNICDENNQMEILEDNQDEMEVVVRCNNCGKPMKYGKIRMINGYVGCGNKITINGKEKECFFGDLMPRVMKCHDSDDPTLYELYRQGKLYRWRDGADGGINEVEPQ